MRRAMLEFNLDTLNLAGHPSKPALEPTTPYFMHACLCERMKSCVYGTPKIWRMAQDSVCIQISVLLVKVPGYMRM